MTETLVALLAVITLGIAVRIWGFSKCAVVIVLFCTAVLPKNITHESAMRHVGIAPSNPELTNYILAFGVLLICVLFRPRHGFAVPVWVPLIVWLFIGANLIWAQGAMQQAGILQLLLGAVAWVVGANISSDLSADNGRFLVRVVSSVIFLQLAVCTLQWLGLNVNPMDANQEAILGSRFNGTLDHPNNLGKAMFLLVAVLLPFGRRLTKADALIWRAAVAAALIVLALTGGRAVSAAAVCMLLIWAVLSPEQGSKRGRKAVTLGVALSAAAFLAGVLMSRFDEDPAGGARGTLTDVAWAQISSAPWWGIGPNSYVDVVGSYDPLTASGVPVHNAFLLALAEIGTIGALSLVLPFAIGAFIAAKNSRLGTFRGEASRVYLSTLPGLYLVSTTGWGVLGGYVFPLMGLAFGLLYAWAKRESDVLSRSPEFVTA